MTDTSRPDEPSTRDLVAQVSENTSRLVRDEMQLAVAEMKAKGKHAGIGLGMFSTAGLLAYFGLAVLIAAGVLALDLALPAWAAALIVAAALFVMAAIAAALGKRETDQAKPPPERTMENIRRDIDTVRERGTR